ncbi:MAG: TldD/PmbA family protein [Syntrophaceae bacterium]
MEAALAIDHAALLKRALAKGGDFSEVFIEHRRGTSITSEARRIERYVTIDDFGAGIRVVQGDKSAYAYSNTLSDIGELADTVAAAVRAHSWDRPIALEKRAPRPIALTSVDPALVDASAKIDLISAAEKLAWGYDPCVVQVKVSYGDTKRRILVANSHGFLSEDQMEAVLFVVLGVVAKDGIIETGYEPIGGARGFELLTEIPPEAVAERALKRAVQTLKARKAPGGMMPVVLASDAGGTMVHEAIGHGLEADLAGEGLSVYSGKLGAQVASTAISVIDDGTLEGRRGSIGYDDEGNPATRTVLVENGILKTYMTDMITAAKYGLAITGNGRRESFRHRPIPRMSNTIIAPGAMNPADIIAKVDKGLYVKKMGGGQVNTVNGDFVFEISEGFLIENGHVAEPIRGATLIGNGPKVLSSITHVGSDLGWGIGTCGKDGQGVPVADAQPTLLIPEITVGGKIDA